MIFRITIIIVLPFIIVWNFANRIIVGAYDGIRYGYWDNREDIEEARRMWRDGLQALTNKE